MCFFSGSDTVLDQSREMSLRRWHEAFRVQPSSVSKQGCEQNATEFLESRHLGIPGVIRQGFLAKAEQSGSSIRVLSSGFAAFTQVTFERFSFPFNLSMEKRTLHEYS